MERSDDIALARSWMHAVGNHDVCTALGGVYAMIASEVAARSPACWASGRCCNFKEAGHRLYVTGLEGAYAMLAPADNAPVTGAGRVVPLMQVPAGGVVSPLARCPFLAGNACGIHTMKPLACRTYFCDATTSDWQQALTERGVREVRAIHDRFGIEYRYAEWGWILGVLREVAV